MLPLDKLFVPFALAASAAVTPQVTKATRKAATAVTDAGSKAFASTKKPASGSAPAKKPASGSAPAKKPASKKPVVAKRV